GNLTMPNLFTRNLMQGLANLTGKSPYIRVGGTSADRTNYIANQTTSLIILKDGENGIPADLTIGPTFFEGFHNFPRSKFHFLLNLAQTGPNGLIHAVAEAKIALQYIGANLASFEIGNECNLYSYMSIRPANYTQDDYVAEWRTIARAVTKEVLVGNPYGINPWTAYQGLVYFVGDFGDSGFSVYPAGPNPSRQGIFMNHTFTAGTLASLIPSLSYLASTNPNLTFVIGETNSDYINIGNDFYVSAFGNALWTCDYMLYAIPNAMQNITRVYMHQGTTFGYSDFTPTQVRPPFYGQLLVASALGTSPATQITPLDLGLWNLSVYALYTASELSKYVIINLDEWNATTPYERPIRSFGLEVPHGVVGACVEVLTAPGADSMSGITWAGISWNVRSDGLGAVVRNDTKVIVPTKGRLHITVQSTEAVVVTLTK
ncbi:hypothetical protein DL95DRAFT_309646, partial [Leptodontidium sp. 2 PMI_412]